MAARSTLPAPTGRYIKGYLLTWGMLAAGGLVYLASLAWQPEFLSSSPPAQVTQPDQGLRAATRALAELGNVRRTLGEMQKDLGQVRETIEQREVNEKAVQARIAALEERVASLPVATATPEATPKQRSAERAKAEKSRKTVEQRRDPRIVTVEPSTPATPPAPVATPESAPVGIETGSIAGPPATITFGEPVVTPARSVFAVQLGAGPSLDAVRLSWSLLVERHSTLGALQPRVVPPRADGSGPYRLVAGPFASRAEADKACAEMGVGRQGCFATTFIGEPL
jgi:hypothetical protein